MVVVSSELEELCGFCTRILVMREGELVAELDGAAATELELLRHAMPDTQEMFAHERCRPGRMTTRAGGDLMPMTPQSR